MPGHKSTQDKFKNVEISRIKQLSFLTTTLCIRHQLQGKETCRNHKHLEAKSHAAKQPMYH